MAKLDHKYFGPYVITKVLGSHAYKLKLPFEHDLIHDTFHTSLLRPAPTDPLEGQTNLPPPPISIDTNGQKLYAIDAILDSKREDNVFYYQVLWRGYNPEDKSWEPLSNVVNARSSILEFERRYPRKPKPTKEEIAAARTDTEQPASETTPSAGPKALKKAATNPRKTATFASETAPLKPSRKSLRPRKPTAKSLEGGVEEDHM